MKTAGMRSINLCAKSTAGAGTSRTCCTPGAATATSTFPGVSGLDFAEDGRAFAVVDFDGDGRPDILLKSRLGPQMRVLQNNCAGANHSIAFRLRGTKSNRDGVGAKIEVDGQTKWLEAGSGFLSQHSKTLLFGLGRRSAVEKVQITWPSGSVQEFSNLSCGRTYSITEGSEIDAGVAFRPHQQIKSEPAIGNNQLALHDTWFLEPVPLPKKQQGPGLFVLQESTPEFEIFRRYLFDWRTSLNLPFAMLLNESGEAVKSLCRYAFGMRNGKKIWPSGRPSVPRWQFPFEVSTSTSRSAISLNSVQLSCGPGLWTRHCPICNEFCSETPIIHEF